MSRPLAAVLLVLAATGCRASEADDCDLPANATSDHCRTAARSPCPVGTRLTLDGTCADVGWTDCAPPFVRDPSGWGCRPVMFEGECPPNTMPLLGVPGCVPVGDCVAPFPPRGATKFVDGAYGPDQLDEAHFATIGDAVNAAASGDVIAVSSGVYAGGIVARVPLTIVGRCPSAVVVRGDGASNGLDAKAEVWVRGLRFENHKIAISGVGLTLDDLVVEDNDAGVKAWGCGDIRHSRVANNRGDGLNGLFAREVYVANNPVLGSGLKRSIVVSDGTARAGVLLTSCKEGVPYATESVFRGAPAGVSSTSDASVTRCWFEGGGLQAGGLNAHVSHSMFVGGAGISVGGLKVTTGTSYSTFHSDYVAGSADVSRTTILCGSESTTWCGVRVEPVSQARLDHVALIGGSKTRVSVEGDSRLALFHSLVSGDENLGVGLGSAGSTASGGSLAIVGSTLEGSASTAISAYGPATLEVSGTLVRKLGRSADAIVGAMLKSMRVADVLLEASSGMGLLAYESNLTARSIVYRGLPDASDNVGVALVRSTADLEALSLSGAAVGLWSAASAAAVRDSRFEDNALGIGAQDPFDVKLEAAPRPAAPGEVVATGCSFTRNATDVGPTSRALPNLH